MIIKSKKNIEGLFQQEYKGDDFVFHHAERIDPILKSANLQREAGNNGWGKNKSMRKIATVPALEFYNNPDLVREGTNKTWRKYLNGEGRAYATVNPNTV